MLVDKFSKVGLMGKMAEGEIQVIERSLAVALAPAVGIC